MRSADHHMGRGLRWVLIATAVCAWSAPVLAGGPLYVVPANGTMKPARWEGTVKVYTDRGDLGAVDHATANKLVASALAEWSSVPTSSFRAQVAGELANDITGANAGQVIGASNGGGIQVIYDHDGSVISDFFGAGFGVLGIATPEYLAAEGSTQIVEGWMIIGGQPDWYNDSTGAPISGVVTHELGHAINLAHTQTNGFYARNKPIPEWGLPPGPDQAGPDQCGHVVADYPTPDQVETMYPFIDPFPDSISYNSPQMATVNVADDIAALSSLYPAQGYRARTGTIKGRIVAKDGTSQLTGINVIARRTDDPFDAISRISGDLTQGWLGPDGRFEMTGLTPGASYLVYIDELGAGGFSTPKAILLGPEEYWDSGESRDATQDDACVSTPITLAAGEVREIEIAINGIDRAPTFTHIPYSLPSDVSDNGQRIAGVYAPFASPFWVWDKKLGMSFIDGRGFVAAISGNGRVVGGSIGVDVETEFGPAVQEYAALWTRDGGWKVIADKKLAGCGEYQTTIWDVTSNGSGAVGLAFADCRDVYAFQWSAATGMRRLHKTSEGAARANAVSGTGQLVGGWEEIPEGFGFRVGSLWQGGEQMLLRDPTPGNPIGGWVGEIMDINAAGTVAVGTESGSQLKEAYKWTPTEGVTSLGRYDAQVCYPDWLTGTEICEDRETTATSVSDDGQVITGASRLLRAGVDDGVIYTPKMGWMLLGDFLESQGVLEASRWLILGAKVSGSGKTLVGTAFPLAADYWHGFRLDLDQVFVCHGTGSHAKTLRVGFPNAMDLHLSHRDSVGFCPGQGPL